MEQQNQQNIDMHPNRKLGDREVELRYWSRTLRNRKVELRNRKVKLRNWSGALRNWSRALGYRKGKLSRNLKRRNRRYEIHGGGGGGGGYGYVT